MWSWALRYITLLIPLPDAKMVSLPTRLVMCLKSLFVVYGRGLRTVTAFYLKILLDRSRRDSERER